MYVCKYYACMFSLSRKYLKGRYTAVSTVTHSEVRHSNLRLCVCVREGVELRAACTSPGVFLFAHVIYMCMHA